MAAGDAVVLASAVPVLGEMVCARGGLLSDEHRALAASYARRNVLRSIFTDWSSEWAAQRSHRTGVPRALLQGTHRLPRRLLGAWIWRGKYIVIDNNTVTAGYVYTKAMGGFSINNVLDLATLRKKRLCGR